MHQDDSADIVIGRKNIFRAAAEKLVRRRGEEALHCRADHDGAAVDGKQKQSVVKPAENLVNVFAQIAENFPDAAELHSDLADLRADLPEFVPAFQRLLIEFAFGDAVELSGNALQWSQRNAADDAGQNGGNHDRNNRDGHRRA